MTRLARLGLRMQLVILVLLAVAPALALTAYTGQQQRQAIQQEARDHVLALARVAARAVSAGLSTSPASATVLEDLALHGGLPDGSQVLLLDSAGGLLARAPGSTAAGQTVTELPRLEAVRSGEEAAGQSGRADGRAPFSWCVALSQATRGPCAAP